MNTHHFSFCVVHWERPPSAFEQSHIYDYTTSNHMVWHEHELRVHMHKLPALYCLGHHLEKCIWKNGWKNDHYKYNQNALNFVVYI